MKPDAGLVAAAGARARAILAAKATLDALAAVPPLLRNPDRLAEARAVLPIGPDPDPCMCGHPRWTHVGVKRVGKCSTDGCTCKRWYTDRIEQLAIDVADADSNTALSDFRWWDKKHADADPVLDGQLRVRPSDAGGCYRRAWYRNFPPANYRPAPTDERPATAGTIAHDGIGRARTERYPWRQIETWVDIPGLDRRGRIDGYDPLTYTLEDLKTVGKNRWSMLAAGPEPSMWAQVLVYALALIRAGYRVERLRVRLLCRDDGHEEVHDRPYDDDAAKQAVLELVDLTEQLEEYREAFLAGADPEELEALKPPRPENATGPDRFPCSWCPAREHCWNVPQAAAAGRSPASWTLLGPDPLEAAIETLLIDYADAVAAEKAAKEAKDVTKDLLHGIPDGTYGRMTYRRSQYKVADAHAQNRELLQILDWPDGMRPKAEAVKANPPKRDQERVTIGPVRAAKRKSNPAPKPAAAPAQDVQLEDGAA